MQFEECVSKNSSECYNWRKQHEGTIELGGMQ